MFVFGCRVTLQRAGRFHARRTNGFSISIARGARRKSFGVRLAMFFRQKIENFGAIQPLCLEYGLQAA
jgi:hypothetical protein